MIAHTYYTDEDPDVMLVHCDVSGVLEHVVQDGQGGLYCACCRAPIVRRLP